MDTNVRQLIWNGAIPVEIHISDPENILNTHTGGTLNLPFYVIESSALAHCEISFLDDGPETAVPSLDG